MVQLSLSGTTINWSKLVLNKAVLTIIHPRESGTFLGKCSKWCEEVGMMWNMTLVIVDHANE
jgi:hypothetical protein